MPRLPISTTMHLVASMGRQGRGGLQEVRPGAGVYARLKYADVTVDPMHPFARGGGFAVFPDRAESWEVVWGSSVADALTESESKSNMKSRAESER